MNIDVILDELISKGILPADVKWQVSHLQGGTVSELYLIQNTVGEKIVVKSNVPALIDAEGEFLKIYEEIDLVPNIMYVEKTHKYLVYSFIEGETNLGVIDKKQMLKLLVEGLINHYKITKKYNGWGWADDFSSSWFDFMETRVEESSILLADYLGEDDFKLVQDLIQNQSNLNLKPFLLHGDCGVHNFIFNGKELKGVIDASPVIGHPMYDLVYAFCSSADDLSKETIDYAFSLMNIKDEYLANNLYKEVAIGLYFRLATCLKHHPEDWPIYKKGWDYWKAIV